MIQIDEAKCCGCSYCVLTCPIGALTSYYTVKIDKKCTDCGTCYHNCPTYAISIPKRR